MRILSCPFFILPLLILPVVAKGQSQPPATKDPQAVNVLQQVLAVAGGATAIAAIKD
jgi:hypothetical protein